MQGGRNRSLGTVLDILKSKKIEFIRNQVNDFCKDVMAGYVIECHDYCGKHSLSFSNTKSFYDSVWGTIEIYEGEIFILDSPILQRLRHIKQLGLANLLYASADHSRFSHTLGVIQTADKMQSQVEKELKKKNVSKDDGVRQIIRLAAIFHDTGHMFCSHASESFFQKNDKFVLYDSIDEIRRDINSRLSIKPSLSEILSVLIVNSPYVRELLCLSSPGLYSLNIQEANIDEIVEKICCFIWGYPYSERLLPYAQIISGQIDADKLDYLKRDSHSTGVPAAVDMSRVFQKLRVVQSNMNVSMKSTNKEDEGTRYTIAIAPAAINTIDQLIISRYMMFENVYYHQKTLTAESLLRYAIEGLCKSTEGLLDNFRVIMLLQDDDVVNANFDASIRNKISDFRVIDEKTYGEACGLLADLSRRKLFKRSVAFTNENLIDAGYMELNFYSTLFKDNNRVEQEKFVSLIKQQMDCCKDLLQGTKYKSNRPTEALLIVSPDISSAKINSNLAIAEKNNKYRDMEFEADNWLKSRSSRKPQNYLITYPEDRFIAYAATEYVLYREYGLLISDPIIYEEKDAKYIEEVKKELEKKGYYKAAYAISPNEEIDIYNRLVDQLVGEKWKKYELISVDNGSAYEMNSQYLITYIKQFYQFSEELGDYPLFVKACFDMLKKVRIISKSEIISALKANFCSIAQKENIAFEKMKICNIGNLQDGSAQISYQINSINEAFKTRNRVISLEDALECSEQEQTIVFVEDAFCSGKQIISIFEEYMGVSERQTRESHVHELNDTNKERLKKSKLYFSFIMYNEKNEHLFRSRMKDMGLENVEIISKEKFPPKYFSANPNDEEKILLAYLKKAGKELLVSKVVDSEGRIKDNWSQERVENSVLGYNDAQQLIVFAWNTPTYTITPLWLKGRINGVEWMPLFPRIDK